ncbi:MAG: UTP--glucose-1-phosphate uridylyltransferase [Actinomycetales bacterium]|jgi:UTP--glucose-1-phosphate uridylyltransferase|uniref:UTP--glucose-1-phosphate uridylyltransferase n=1 Tax=Candidatus Phosphoribacter hodrii TaxID=2953743 RepID=A0A935CDX1_9MICO|nr:UTP--glucose-1-phosphate uridylyltransferase [Candidatus Phosphoribacter hodrii]OPZ56551.1 MAG: putative uridylyltransferase [bacterium ADurb.BinA028]HNV15968.1 UTP--glucose-1-phosphate uridylyltransferase [Dermatophilaceae bacterium]MBK7271910.1 UTP--glucose-1-phosphate uridylyltransferase [Candidatus Phosphoribacter hodrii]MBL0005004.1 UTP--glucose-1-phosphate uridylyltransferase [Candidatus Phosphoribacter hodrii]
MSAAGLAEAARRMHERGLDERAIAVFSDYYHQLELGAQGTIPEDSIEPLVDLTRLDGVGATEAERAQALGQVVVIKLNGGLGTSMGLAGAKSALSVRDGLTFLDVIARQVLALRAQYAAPLPVIFMNSFRTHEETEAILAAYPDLPVRGLPLGFLQSAEPKLRVDDLSPVDWPANPELEWCPPGHGDVYLSLARTGLLDALRGMGIRYAFLSNADNLGATCDPDIAAWLLREQVPYLAEVCTRTVNDRKGGHLARRRSDGRIVLRDNAMVVPGEEPFFADETRHSTFHANNLWVDLDVVARMLDERAGVLGLPIIVNRKTVDPTDKSSTKVIQIECAMGTAIEAIDGSRAMHVPRSRFRPVKTTNELTLVRSDLFRFEPDWRVAATTERPDPLIDLSSEFAFVDDLERLFPAGVPSLRECDSLRVRGDVTFGAGVVCRGDVLVQGPVAVPDAAVLTAESAGASGSGG